MTTYSNEKDGTIGTLVKILELSKSGKNRKEIIRSLNLSPNDSDPYFNLISELGLAAVTSNCMTNTYRGNEFIESYNELQQKLKNNK